MRNIFLIFLLTISSIVHSQHIKIKKGNILLNKKDTIGYSEYKSLKTYSIKDNNGNEVITQQIMGDSGSTNDYFYRITTNFNSETLELPASEIGFSTEKGTIKYLINNGYWDKEKGLDVDAINLKMISTGNAITAAKEASIVNEERVKSINPYVLKTGEIVKGGNEGTEIIGYVESPDTYIETKFNQIKIYDKDKNLIAKGKSTIIKDEVFTTFDGVEHKYDITYELNEITKPLFLSELVYLLILEGYIYDGDKVYDKQNSVFN